jgi:hypothetical protein
MTGRFVASICEHLEVTRHVAMHMPKEKEKVHGQAMAARLGQC